MPPLSWAFGSTGNPLLSNLANASNSFSDFQPSTGLYEGTTFATSPNAAPVGKGTFVGGTDAAVGQNQQPSLTERQQWLVEQSKKGRAFKGDVAQEAQAAMQAASGQGQSGMSLKQKLQEAFGGPAQSKVVSMIGGGGGGGGGSNINIQALIDSMMSGQQSANQAAQQQYQALIDSLSGTFDAARQDAMDRGQAGQQAARQNAISRGLGNTTITDSLQRGVESDTQRALNQLTAQEGQLMGSAILSKQNTFDPSSYLNLLSALG